MRLIVQRLCCVFILFVTSTLGAFAQLSLDAFPADFQLYGRFGQERIVEVPIRGSVDSTSGITSLSAKLLVGTNIIDADTIPLEFVDGEASFEMTLQLPVTRTNHRVELRNTTTNELLALANNVVAGDVYLINGQSNAQAGYYLAVEDRDPFLRGYNPDRAADFSTFPGWTTSEHAACGQWMGRAANSISQAYDLPIAIFNFAEGGQPLTYFERDAPSQNFEYTFSSLSAAGVKEQVKGFLWSQGEADGFGTSIKEYRTQLTSFFETYLDSLPLVDEVYLWQVRAFSCAGRTPNVMEAQRRMNDALPFVKMLSTVNVEGHPDSCHFPYNNGRATLGNWIADVLLVEKYGEVKTGYFSPTVDSARITGPNKITLFFDLKGAENLVATGMPWADFAAEGLQVRADSGAVSGGTVDLFFKAEIGAATGVSYFAHVGQAMDYLHSNRGLGVVTFYNETLTPGDRATGSIPDADLRMQTDVTRLVTGTDVLVEIALINQGDRSLRETEVRIPLPIALRYGDGSFVAATEGVFDNSSDTWLVPFVRPQDTATLRIRYRVLDDSLPIPVWAQVVHSELEEVDSQPFNGTLGRIQEDDEARVVLGDATQNCSFGAQLISSECIPDSSFTYWRIAFSTDGLPSDSALTFNFSPTEALDTLSSVDQMITLSFDTLSRRDALPLFLQLEQNGDSTCTSSFILDAPDSCRLTVVVVPPDTLDTSNGHTPKLSALSFSPNPVRSGAVVELSQRTNLFDERIFLFDATGREVYAARLGAQQTQIQLPNLPAGMYLLRVGRSVGKVLIY